MATAIYSCSLSVTAGDSATAATTGHLGPSVEDLFVPSAICDLCLRFDSSIWSYSNDVRGGLGEEQHAGVGNTCLPRVVLDRVRHFARAASFSAPQGMPSVFQFFLPATVPPRAPPFMPLGGICCCDLVPVRHGLMNFLAPEDVHRV